MLRETLPLNNQILASETAIINNNNNYYYRHNHRAANNNISNQELFLYKQKMFNLRQTIGFQTLHSSRRSNSQCDATAIATTTNSIYSMQKSPLNNQQQQQESLVTFDNRLEWYCKCELGFSGFNCGQKREFTCDNGLDDDLDGLTDCEDSDCCSQNACKDNHLCYQSPDPSKLLHNIADSMNQHQHQQQQPITIDHDDAFFAQYKFFIANNSVQLWAKESSFDPKQVAVIRGRVVRGKSHNKKDLNDNDNDNADDDDDGIVSVHVRVADIPTNKIGFTLTRSGGHFDLLVPAQNSWITLHFLRNAYNDVEKQVQIRAQTINVLESPIVMQLAAAAPSDSTIDQEMINNQSAAAKASQSDLIGNQASSSVDISGSFGVQMLTSLYRLTQSTIMSSRLQQKLDESQIGRLVDCLKRSLILQAPQWRAHEPTIRATTSSSSQHLKTFRLASSEAYETSMKLTSNENIQLQYNSAAFPAANSIVKPALTLQLMPNNHQSINNGFANGLFKLTEILLYLNIEGQLVSEKLKPIDGLTYQFAWNRRNVYGQKVYGFSPLNIKVLYKYKTYDNSTTTIDHIELVSSDCLAPYNLQENDNNNPDSDLTSNKSTILGQILRQNLINLYASQAWDSRNFAYEGRIYMEGHQLNQHTDLGKWTLGSLTNRLDRLRQTLYLGSGRSIPLKLAYPLTISEPIPLIEQAQVSSSSSSINNNFVQQNGNNQPTTNANISPPNTLKSSSKASKVMTRGPNNTMYLIQKQRLIQLDSSGQKRLIDLSVNILTSKFGLINSPNDYVAENDLELLYNEPLSMLYVSSRLAGKIVQISHSTLLLLNRTARSNSSGLLGPDEEIEMEPLCGFGQRSSTIPLDPPQIATAASTSSTGTTSSVLPVRSCRLARLSGPHSMALDEKRQMLYFVDGNSSLMALELVSNLLTTLLSSRVISQPNQASQQQQQQQPATIISNGNCKRSDLQLPLQAYKPLILSSLVFCQSDQSVYFVDQNTVFALRQDLSLELVALGSRPARADFIQALGPNCLAQKRRLETQLGQIKALAIDEANHELLIAHQWTSQQVNNNNDNQSFDLNQQQQIGSNLDRNNNNKGKLIGRFYLAKLKLGLMEIDATTTTTSNFKEHETMKQNLLYTNNNKPLHRIPNNKSQLHAFPGSQIQRQQQQQQQQPLFDLHSAPTTYDSTLVYLASSSKEKANGTSSIKHHEIDWFELSKTPNLSKPIAFLHLLFGGFERIDCIEISSDGSIFVLDSASHNLRLVEQFNADIWAQNPSKNSQETMDHFVQWTPNGPEPRSFDKQNNHQMMSLMNPISGDIMQFHAQTGLQIGLATKQLQIQSPLIMTTTTTTKLTNTNEQIGFFSLYYELISDHSVDFQWDEDDRNDIAIQRAFSIPNNNKQQQQQHQVYTSPFVRLSKIMDNQGIEYNILRKPLIPNTSNNIFSQATKSTTTTTITIATSNSNNAKTKLIARAIFVNGQVPLLELSCDDNGLLVEATEIAPTSNYSANFEGLLDRPTTSYPSSLWTQKMDFSYDLLSNLLIEQNLEKPQKASSQTKALGKTITTPNQSSSNINKLRKRILYDRIFNHYCDLVKIT